MPELPEVETIRRDLAKQFAGKQIDKVEVTGTRSVRRHPDTSEFVGLVQGRQLVSAMRRGKYLLLRLDSGDVLVVHLGMSGQLLSPHSGEPMGKHTHVVLSFSGAQQLRFIDPRTFGELFVSAPGDSGTLP